MPLTAKLHTMNQKILVCYSFEKIDPVRRKQFDRRMFGTIEKSHRGKYKSKIQGILSNIKHERPVRSVIVFNEKYKEKITGILKEFSAKIYEYRVVP